MELKFFRMLSMMMEEGTICNFTIKKVEKAKKPSKENKDKPFREDVLFVSVSIKVHEEVLVESFELPVTTMEKKAIDIDEEFSDWIGSLMGNVKKAQKVLSNIKDDYIAMRNSEKEKPVKKKDTQPEKQKERKPKEPEEEKATNKDFASDAASDDLPWNDKEETTEDVIEDGDEISDKEESREENKEEEAKGSEDAMNQPQWI